MSGISGELEQELEFELEGELENEFEFEQEHEQEGEHEVFFNHLAGLADRAGRSQALRRIALAAARQALRQRPRRDPAIEGEFEYEASPELELETSPSERAQLEAMMEHSGHAAAEAANEQEAAEHFLPLIPLAAKFAAAKLLPIAAKFGGKLLAKAAPKLIKKFGPRLLGKVARPLTRGLANVTRTLFRNPTTRPLVHAVPRIARRTMLNLASRIGRGQRITPQLARKTLAKQTYRVLRNPRTLSQTYRRSLALDRRYHRQTRRVLGRPGVRGTSSGGPGAGGGSPGEPGGGIAPGAAAGVPGVGAAPAYAGGTSTGGCRCNCQPAVGAMGGMVPAPAIAVCPTCGR
jgi:hypothetical protein